MSDELNVMSNLAIMKSQYIPKKLQDAVFST